MSIPLITTSRWDVEDGHTLEGYLRTGGYEGLRRALEMTPVSYTHLTLPTKA